MRKIAVIMGSSSDLPVVQPAADTLKRFEVPHTVHVFSAHRTPDELAKFAKSAADEGYAAFICAAGKAAALPGAVAAYTTLPVIGLPVKSSFLDGLDSLLSMVQMPSGVPVATVAVNGAENAALLAVQILAVNNSELRAKLENYKAEQREKVLKG
ncbi:MAG: 5-(carboxyamino)imidazole ribonucleotide mutase [Oscillospiraceae bacterium]|jgi:5-(carboxyamino)imidazole ribonucleotide mutase|nr:5-(carboxyamino)imidazole ribonucleotide mutase [Oscillospiraceae bacterium]